MPHVPGETKVRPGRSDDGSQSRGYSVNCGRHACLYSGELMHRKPLMISKRASGKNGPISTRCCARERVKTAIFAAS